MDTQGTFDNQSSMEESTKLFAFTTLVSSVLVYNLMTNIQEDDLMNLQFFTSFANFMQKEGFVGHPYQVGPLFFLFLHVIIETIASEIAIFGP